MSPYLDIVIFGGTGDLAIRKLLPALFRADTDGALRDDTRIFITSRESEDDAHILQRCFVGLKTNLHPSEFQDAHWQRFRERLKLQALDITQLDQRWDTLSASLNGALERTRLFYFAISPSLYGQACAHLAECGLITDTSRAILEKPLGYDLPSAAAIHEQVGQYFREDQIYRIDHYLGKETVQNLLALRFTNTLFEDMWDGKNIQHVQITVAETVGLEGRAEFYDGVGALRDMVQNHLLQLLALVAMEPPNRMDPQSVRAEKLKVMQALRPITGDEVARHTVRGQYATGTLNGKAVSGYRDELGGDSSTETFVALRAYIDNWRWSRVPFFLRTGKRLKERFAEIVIQYRPVSHRVYGDAAGEPESNRLVIRLQPEESIKLTLMAKAMNQTEMRLRPETLNLNFADSQGGLKSDAYKRLLLDAAAGNSTLFAHRDEVEQAWRWVDPIIEAWQSPQHRLHLYPAGSWGPYEAEELLRANGGRWYHREDAA